MPRLLSYTSDGIYDSRLSSISQDIRTLNPKGSSIDTNRLWAHNRWRRREHWDSSGRKRVVYFRSFVLLRRSKVADLEWLRVLEYTPAGTSVRFVSWYDYRTRFGRAGRLIDRLVFRRLLAWATAWSFDRPRLWIEREISPETSFRMALINAWARIFIAFIWVWQGLVPKVMFPSVDEKLMLTAAGAPLYLLPTIGFAEVLLGMPGFALWCWRGFFVVNCAIMLAAILVSNDSTPRCNAASDFRVRTN